jgi:uncharacterized protein YcaQ
LLDAMHYRGFLRVARRDGGVRVYAPRGSYVDVAAREARETPEARHARADALVRLIVGKYAPLPSPTLARLVSMLRHGAPQLGTELKSAHERAKKALPYVRIDGVDWYWPDERGKGAALVSVRAAAEDRVRLLAPFDPVVWDRTRFALFWGWEYRFEAYTPAAKRERGYYALPLLWRDHVVGWGNVSASDGKVSLDVGYVTGRPPRERAFDRELEAERERLRVFLYGP